MDGSSAPTMLEQRLISSLLLSLLTARKHATACDELRTCFAAPLPAATAVTTAVRILNVARFLIVHPPSSLTT
jgi:hypothetical protein